MYNSLCIYLVDRNVQLSFLSKKWKRHLKRKFTKRKNKENERWWQHKKGLKRLNKRTEYWIDMYKRNKQQKQRIRFMPKTKGQRIYLVG